MTRTETPVSTAKMSRHEPKADCGAERRRDQRSHAEDKRDRGELHARLPALEQVADDRPGRMPTAPALAPCTSRKASSAWIEGASAAPAAVRVNRTRPTAMTILRPNRSASGPTTIGALEKPAMKIAIAAAASVCGA